MDWIEVALRSDGEAVEAIADLLQQYGYQGVAIQQLGIVGEAWEDELPPSTGMIVRAYLPNDSQAPTLKQKLEDGLGYLAQIYPAVPREPAYRLVNDEDWAEAWKTHYHPLHIGRAIYIRPQWEHEAPAPDDIEIVLDPGMAFGTGTHPSTQLCLIALEDQPRPLPTRVLDLGCGSGVLAIAAAKLGAEHVWGLDIDQLAIQSTQENAILNGVSDRITAEQGSLDSLIASPRRFGLILVNILAKTIIPMCEQGLGHVVQPGGVGIFSGIIEEQAADVEAALRAAGLIPTRRRTMGDWVSIEARRED
jgi:ribosomal protein L11 methyltransferase